jgi:hypothetical protein
MTGSQEQMEVTGASARALQKIRAGYGVALLLAPGTTIYLVTGRRSTRRMRRIAQLLGARHLAQTMLTTAAPTPGVFALGSQADALHAASMLLAAVSRTGRRAALTDALAETAFAVAGFFASTTTALNDAEEQSAELGQDCR